MTHAKFTIEQAVAALEDFTESFEWGLSFRFMKGKKQPSPPSVPNPAR